MSEQNYMDVLAEISRLRIDLALLRAEVAILRSEFVQAAHHETGQQFQTELKL